jgi:hypothetical protein
MLYTATSCGNQNTCLREQFEDCSQPAIPLKKFPTLLHLQSIHAFRVLDDFVHYINYREKIHFLCVIVSPPSLLLGSPVSYGIT